MVVRLVVGTVVGEHERGIDGLVVGLERKIVRRVFSSALILYAMGAAWLLEKETVCTHRIRVLCIKGQ